jgi:ABC-type lipoprotein release transport system permease subunit
LRVTALGVAFGLAGAAGLGLSMRAILVDTDPTDPVILAGAAALLGATALLAGFLPAHRASRVDPVTALRAD